MTRTTTPNNSNNATPPWQEYDPTESPRYALSLRLNAYHLTMLRHLAEVEDRSQQKILRTLLLPALEEKAGVRQRGDTTQVPSPDR